MTVPGWWWRTGGGGFAGPGGFLEAQSAEPKSQWFENVATGTRRALVRRLKAICPQIVGLIGEAGRFDPF